MQIKNFFILILILGFLVSCETDDNGTSSPDIPGAYGDGFFVLNEGLFGQGNSSVTFINPANDEVSRGIFTGVNGVELGDTASDMGFYEEMLFIVVNVSNKIEVVEQGTFVSLTSIETNLENPRKIAYLDGMAYVTNWGDASNPDDDYIAVFNAEDFELITKIAVEEGPEDILVEGGRIFVAHKGGWNFNNKVSVISGNELEKVIEVGDVPNSLSVANGSLWVSSAGFPDWAGETAGSISRIDLTTLEVTKTFGNAAASWHPNHLAAGNGRIYYTVGKEVYSFEPGDETLSSSASFTMDEVTNLYGFTLHDGRIYAASASADYTGDGKLYIYNAATGNLESTYDTGINPNGIFFMK